MLKALEYLLGIFHKRTPTRDESKRNELRKLEKELEQALKYHNNFAADRVRARMRQLREEIRNSG